MKLTGRENLRYASAGEEATTGSTLPTSSHDGHSAKSAPSRWRFFISRTHHLPYPDIVETRMRRRTSTSSRAAPFTPSPGTHSRLPPPILTLGQRATGLSPHLLKRAATATSPSVSSSAFPDGGEQLERLTVGTAPGAAGRGQILPRSGDPSSNISYELRFRLFLTNQPPLPQNAEFVHAHSAASMGHLRFVRGCYPPPTINRSGRSGGGREG